MEVKVELSFPKLEFVSDRTFRESLKLASQKIHQIHLDEVLYVIETSSLSEPMQQSARDRVIPQLDHVPNYYIDVVVRGSLTILVSLSAAAYFILQKTLGKTLESSWERSPTHKRLVAYLSNASAAQGALASREERSRLASGSSMAQGERWAWLVREFSYHFLNNARFGRFRVVRLNFEQEQSRDMLVRVEFGLADEHLALEGTFKPFLYKDYLEQFTPKRAQAKRRRRRKTS